MQAIPNTEDPSEITSNWVKLYSDNLYSWAFHKTSCKHTAEDLVQETFLVAVKSFENFTGRSSPKTWLFAILNNKINDYYRKNFKTPLVQDEAVFKTYFDHTGHWREEETPIHWTDTDSSILDDTEFQVQLHTCLKKLPPNWFSAIHLKFMAEKKGNEICQELGITDTNFWQILRRAKLQLRKCLEINWFN